MTRRTHYNDQPVGATQFPPTWRPTTLPGAGRGHLASSPIRMARAARQNGLPEPAMPPPSRRLSWADLALDLLIALALAGGLFAVAWLATV